jgi:hypothetical protein
MSESTDLVVVPPADITLLPVGRSSTHQPHTMPWTWRAIYGNGTYIDEMDDEGFDVHGAKDVWWDRVVLFQLIPCRPGLVSPTVHVDLERGQRVIYFRRMQAEINLMAGTVSEGHLLAHVIGYQETVEGVNIKHLTYWYENGSCLITSDDSVN